MKSFKEYLTESKKVYSFKIKVAGELPESFTDKLKERLMGYEIVNLQEVAKTPIQKLPLDFPEMTNSEVTVFEIVTEYPITAPELEKHVCGMGIDKTHFRIRGSGEPTEIRQIELELEKENEDKEKTALLNDANYSEETPVDHKDYTGEEHKASFLQDLLKAQKERLGDLGYDKLDSNIYNNQPKSETKLSPVGSK